MKKILLFCMMSLGIMGNAQINTTEGFESTTFLPPNWSTGTSAFSRTVVAGYFCNGIAAARRNLFGNTTNVTAYISYNSSASNGKAISISFNYVAKKSASSTAVANGNMVVEYSVDGGTNWAALGTQVNFTADVTCTPFVASIPEGAVPLDANFSLRITGTKTTPTTGTSDWNLIIDDVVISQVTPCAAPADVAVSNITSNSGVLSWTALATPPANGYDIYVSTSSNLPLSTVTPTYTNVTGTSKVLTNLSPLTAYFVWLRANCTGSEKSVWSLSQTKFPTPCASTATLTTTGATVCQNQPATLSGTTTAGNVISWYDASVDGNLLGSGSNFTTPPLAATTNYYASTSTSPALTTTAKTQYSNGAASGAVSPNAGLMFDVLSPFVIESVTIYPNSETNATGTVIVDVLDNAGAIVHTKTLTVVGTPLATLSPYIAKLNFQMLPGTNYKMRIRSFTGIFGVMFDPSATAVAGNQGFPYDVAGLLSIKYATNTAAPTNTQRLDLYYYFYDWKISTKCESSRQVVVATVDSACLGTSEVNTGKSVKVYPNPFSEEITISDVEKVKSVSFTDVSGKLIEVINKPTSVLRFNKITSGMYILILEMKDGSKLTEKIIKK